MSVRAQREQKVEKTEAVVAIAEAQNIATNTHHHHVGKLEKMRIYNGELSSTLSEANLMRVRELQNTNDELQRKITSYRHECSHSQDPLKIVNDIEYCNATIARNTGEILNIFAQNDKRLAQIAELERQNINMQQEITDTMSAFGTNNDHEKKTEFASGYFNAKSTLDNNVSLLLKLHAA